MIILRWYCLPLQLDTVRSVLFPRRRKEIRGTDTLYHSEGNGRLPSVTPFRQESREWDSLPIKWPWERPTGNVGGGGGGGNGDQWWRRPLVHCGGMRVRAAGQSTKAKSLLIVGIFRRCSQLPIRRHYLHQIVQMRGLLLGCRVTLHCVVCGRPFNWSAEAGRHQEEEEEAKANCQILVKRHFCMSPASEHLLVEREKVEEGEREREREFK